MSFMFNGVTRYLVKVKRAPAAQYDTKAAALPINPDLTCLPTKAYLAGSENSTRDDATPTRAVGAEPPLKNGALDFVVRLAGSKWSFFGTMVLLVAWIVVGIVYGPSDTWQVILGDASSLQTYVSATFLMRQQQNATRTLLGKICSRISRSESNERMLRMLKPEQLARVKKSTRPSRQDLSAFVEPKVGVFDRISNEVSACMGSLWAMSIYWAGILIWLFMGFPLGFSDTWQLHINTATAIELTITTMFLQAVRKQHEKEHEEFLLSIDVVDENVELELRRMTGNMAPNPVISSELPRLTCMEKMVDTYAFVIGGNVGVAISVLVLAGWLSVGPKLEFSDNWFLIIGTYTGLVGFVDAFVLRNVEEREAAMAGRHFERLALADARQLALLDLPEAGTDDTFAACWPATATPNRRSLRRRIGDAVGLVCAHVYASVGSVAVVVLLLAMASAMEWTERGQLLCNTPTMIVEGFLLLTLYDAHTTSETTRRAQWTGVLNRRIAVERKVCGAQDASDEETKPMSEKKTTVARTPLLSWGPSWTRRRRAVSGEGDEKVGN